MTVSVSHERQSSCHGVSNSLIVIITLLTLLLLEVCGVSSHEKCPVTTGTLYAYPEGDTISFHDNFNPIFQTKIDSIDDLLFDDVRCTWEVRAKNDHLASVAITDLHLLSSVGSKEGDCLKIYDGSSQDGVLLASLCGDDTPSESYTSSEDRFLYVVYTRGKRTGSRHFKLTFKALARSKEFIIKIAIIASGSIAVVAVTFLLFKFTRCCLPCRKRCCPAREAEPPQRELRPLNSVVVTPLATVNGVDETSRSQMRTADGLTSEARQVNLPPILALSVENVPEPEDDEQSPFPDELPPSYDSIFGRGEDGAKANT